MFGMLCYAKPRTYLRVLALQGTTPLSLMVTEEKIDMISV
jgi:hypothetical protein